MISLEAKIRKELGRKVEGLREKGILPGVLYGPGLETLSVELGLKEFKKVHSEAGESSLIQLLVDGKKFIVLIHALELDTLSQEPIHVDFYQPKLDEEITVTIPLVFEGEAPAVKELSGTFVRNIHEVEVRALPQNLPHEIKVSTESLKTFEDSIQVKDLPLLEGVEILREPKDIVAQVMPPEKVEEELEKPIEEKVEEVEGVGEKKEETEGEEKEEVKEEKGEKKEKQDKK